MSAVGVQRRTASEYLIKCLQLYTAILDNLSKFVGSDSAPVQIDQFYISDQGSITTVGC